jgi:hypothetical protein
MPLDDLGEAIAEGAVEGLAASVPLPLPPASGGPPMPPPPGSGGDGAPPPPEEPQRRATVPIVVALALTALVAAGAFALVSWARSGNGCERGDFESVRFGYCAKAPAGWQVSAAGSEGSALDRFLVPDGAAVITVTAVRLTQGQDLDRFEQFVRGYAEDAGGAAGPSSPIEIDDTQGIRFDVQLDGADGIVRSREVLVARDGLAWRVTLADDQVGFEASLRQLDEFLESWRFV